MKKHLLKLSIFLALGGVIYFAGMDMTSTHASGAPTKCTGSPKDGNTCVQSGCHKTLKGTENWISSNIPVTGYVPGTTYTITCKAVNTASGFNSNFGFECSPQSPSTGKVVGTLANINTSGTSATQILSSEWVTHTSASYQATDSNKWSFSWTAPAAGVGAVNFYAAFNCGSSDDNSTADIYTDSVHFAEENTTGIDQVAEANSSINVYPNPIKDQFTISYSLQESKQVEIKLYSIDGKEIGTLLSATEQMNGDHSQALHIPSVKSGIYIIAVTEGEQTSYSKVVVE